MDPKRARQGTRAVTLATKSDWQQYGSSCFGPVTFTCVPMDAATLVSNLDAHRSRIVAGLVAILAIVIQVKIGAELLSVPLFLASLIPLTRSAKLASLVDGVEARLRGRYEYLRSSGKRTWVKRKFIGGFVWIFARTDGIADEYVRDGVRVGLISFVAMILAMIAYAVAMVVFYVVLFILVIVFAAGMLFAALAEGSGGGGGAVSSRTTGLGAGPAAPPGPPAPRNAAAHRMRGTRIVNQGVFMDLPSGLRIGDDGRLMKEGAIIDEDTGYRLHEDGRVQKGGLMGYGDTGFRISPSGRIQKDTLLGYQDTGTRIGEDGSVQKDSFLGYRDTGERFKK